MKAIFSKSPDGKLVPASEEALKIVAQYKPGDEVLIEHTRGRSAKFHRRAFAFFATTFDMQDTYTDPEIWRKVLEMAAGHFETVIDKHGKTQYWPKSIAWDKLPDEDTFRELFGRVVNAFLARYGHALNEAEINMIVGF